MKARLANTPSFSSLILLAALLALAGLTGCIESKELTVKEDLEQFIQTFSTEDDEATVEEGYAEIGLRQKGRTVGRLSVTDVSGDPEALKAYQNSKVTIAGYPARSANLLSNETMVLIGDQFELKVRGELPSYDEATRLEWIKANEPALSKLSRSSGPSVGWLVTVLVVAVILLLVLILIFKMQAFLALLLASIFVGIGSGMPLDGVVTSVVDGMGNSLGFIATIIGLGAILGKVLEFSGGAESLAKALLRTFGEKKAPWAMLVTGFLISIPVFFDVGLVILISIVYALARDSKKSLLYFGLPLIAGMATTHAFIPPTPGPILVAENLGVGLGWVIIFGFIIGFPTAIIAGPMLGCWLAKKHFVPVPDMDALGIEDKREGNTMKLPSLLSVLTIIGLPIILILQSTILKVLTDQGKLTDSPFTQILAFVGHPIIALIISTLFALYYFGTRRGVSRDKLMELSTASLGPAGIIILVTGAGGVFKQILGDSGVGRTLADLIAGSALSPIVLAYIFAVIVRVTQGSATVSMIAASSLIAPVVAQFDLNEMNKALVVIAIAAGSTILSHVNDSGFWIVNRYFGMTEKKTLQTWTVVTTVISVVGFTLAWIISQFV